MKPDAESLRSARPGGRIRPASAWLGLNQGTSGNVSARSPRRLPDHAFRPGHDGTGAADMVPVDMDGQAPEGLKPSSEWRFHRDIYAAFPEAGAIVHAHSPFAVALACLRRDIPAFHYMVAMAGGVDIRCARYATFGTQALSDAVLEASAGSPRLPDGQSRPGGLGARPGRRPGPGRGGGGPVRPVPALSPGGRTGAAERRGNGRGAGEIPGLRERG
jgi:hypothetical protein